MQSPSSRLTGRSRERWVDEPVLGKRNRLGDQRRELRLGFRHRRHRVVATEPEPRKCLADLLRDDPGKLVQLGATRRWQRVEDRAVRVHAVEKQRVQVRVEVE